MEKYTNEFNDSVNGVLSGLNTNKTVNSVVIIFLVLYATLAAPKLPPYILNLFNNCYFNLFVFFLIAYLANQNPTVAIIAALCVMVTINALHRFKLDEALRVIISRENMAQINTSVPIEVVNEPLPESIDVASQKESNMILSDQDLQALRQDSGISSCMPTPPPEDDCTLNLKYRDNFYPQYVHMNTDAYDARYTGKSVVGYDNDSNYAPAVAQ